MNLESKRVKLIASIVGILNSGGFLEYVEKTYGVSVAPDILLNFISSNPKLIFPITVLGIAGIFFYKDEGDTRNYLKGLNETPP